MIRLDELKPGDRLVADGGHPSFHGGQVVEVVRLRRGDVLWPGEPPDTSDRIVADTDMLAAHGGKWGPCILAVRSDGGTGRRWVRPAARNRPDGRLREEDVTLAGFLRAEEAARPVQPAQSRRRGGKR